MLLDQEIGRLNMELDWVIITAAKLNGAQMHVDPVKQLRDKCHPLVRAHRASRTSYYDKPMGEFKYNPGFIRLIDEQYLRTPFLGCRQLAD